METLTWVALGLALCLVWRIYAQWHMRQAWPDFGGRITALKSEADSRELLDSAAAEDALVVVDCYALWCPPCRQAAPAFAKMSMQLLGQRRPGERQ